MKTSANEDRPHFGKPRITPAGWRAAAVFLFLPFMGFCLLLDGLFYLYATRVLGRCYGIFCLFN